MSCGSETGRRRLIRLRRDRVREKQNNHLPASITLDSGTYFLPCDFSLAVKYFWSVFGARILLLVSL